MSGELSFYLIALWALFLPVPGALYAWRRYWDMGLPLSQAYLAGCKDQAFVMLIMLMATSNAGGRFPLWLFVTVLVVSSGIDSVFSMRLSNAPTPWPELAGRLETSILAAASRSYWLTTANLSEWAHPVYLPEHWVARLNRAEVNALAWLPSRKRSYWEFAVLIRLPSLGLFAVTLEHPGAGAGGLVLAFGMPLYYLRHRIGDVDGEAAKLSGDPAVYISAIARSAWIHRRELTKMSPVGRLVGLRTPQQRIERIAREHGLSPDEVAALVAQSSQPASDAYPLPPQLA